jgi:nucleoside-diphosphate-sugar epimerase
MTLDLVTGGAGFIGSHLVTHLLERGRRVRVVDDLSTGRMERLADVRDRIEFVQADLAEADLTPVLAGAERVFHLAAVSSVPRSVKDPLTSHRTIATATLRLLVAARDEHVGAFVLSSSSSVYGETTVSPKHERLAARPISPYGVAKLAAEGYARTFASLYGLRTVSLRYFNVFGPGQDERSAYAAVIPLFITAALHGRPLTVHGDGTQTRDFTFVDNVVAANVAAAADGVPAGGVYNIANGDPHSVNELVAELGRIMGRTLEVTHGPARPGDILHSHASNEAARRDLGWSPTVDFAEGLERTVDWYRRSARQ